MAHSTDPVSARALGSVITSCVHKRIPAVTVGILSFSCLRKSEEILSLSFLPCFPFLLFELIDAL